MVNRAALGHNRELRTERLVLRQLGPDDFDGVWAGLHDSEAMRSTGTHATFTEDAVRGFLARLRGDDERADWAITLAADGTFLGEIALNDLREEDETMNVRIALVSPAVHGQGYGSEAMRAVVGFALDEVRLHRLELSVFEFNGPARRVYEKVGFVTEGVLRDALLWDGVRHDAVVMSILATDPRPA
jgi:RimJ/RimL family protein N-acetyltransferase